MFPDGPEIITEESYIQKEDGVQLELVCIVHASPRAEVTWYKDGVKLTADAVRNDSRMAIGHTGREYLLTISDVEVADRGRYTCHAVNNIGESKGNIQVMGN